MFCTQCGAPADAAAKFCAKCGTALGGHTGTASVAVSLPVNEAKKRVNEAKKRAKFWLWFLGFLMFGTYAFGFITTSSGELPIPQVGYGCLLWTALFYWLWWQWRGRKGWHGLFIGAAVGLLVYSLMAAFAGYVHASA